MSAVFAAGLPQAAYAAAFPVKDVRVLLGEELSPGIFLREGLPVEINAVFDAVPDTWSPGKHTAAILLPAGGGSVRRFEAVYEVLLESAVTYVEAGSPGGWGPPGTEHGYTVYLDGREVPCKTVVRDTTPPVATPVARTVCTADEVAASDLVENIRDYSEVSCEFLETPDFSDVGEYRPIVVLTDAYGNRSRAYARLNVVADTSPPVIEGAADITVKLNRAVLYREGVSAVDDFDASPQLEIDASAVDTGRFGSYPVVYRAVDASGNEAVSEIVLTVDGVEADDVYAYADKALSGIIAEGMSERERAYAVYKWVKSHLYYSHSGPDGTDTLMGAYSGFTRGTGDCFTYYAVSEVLLTCAGIKNQRIQRVPGTSASHFWNLVDVGEGWRHFDACPPFVRFDGFLFTEGQARRYAALQAPYREKYYTYDKSLYPEVAE